MVQITDILLYITDVEKLCCSCPETVKHLQEDFLRHQKQQQRLETSKPVTSRQTRQTANRTPVQVADKHKSVFSRHDQTPEATVVENHQTR